VSGTTVIFTENSHEIPLLLLRQLQLFHVLHQNVILLTPDIADEPVVQTSKQLEMKSLGENVFHAIVRFGFMQNPNIPNVLKNIEVFGGKIDLKKVVYYIEYPSIVYVGKRNGKRFLAKLFSLMARNTPNPASLFSIPPSQVFEVGVRMKL